MPTAKNQRFIERLSTHSAPPGSAGSKPQLSNDFRALARKVDAGTQFLLIGAVGLIAFVSIQVLFLANDRVAGLIVGSMTYFLGCGLAYREIGRSFPHPSLGLCNMITLARFACVCLLLSALVDGTTDRWAIIIIATLAFVSDGVDGWLARRTGYASTFGARFDVEVDSVFALTLALLAFFLAGAPWYVLLLGLPRYLFGGGAFIFPWLDGQLPERFIRKAVCVFQVAALIALLIPGFSHPMNTVLIASVLTALSWSFFVDIKWLKEAQA
ncbi:MAG: CDP-alcohol phosphatidyltransferase family protein [Pseudomonadota bacterium]